MAAFALSLHKKGHYITYFDADQERRVSLTGDDWHALDEEKCKKVMQEYLPGQALTFVGTIRYPRKIDHLPLGNPLESDTHVHTHFDLGWSALQKVGSGKAHVLWTDDWTYALGAEISDLHSFNPQDGQYSVWWQKQAYQAACLFSGNEQERQCQHLASHFKVDVSEITNLPYMPSIVKRLRERFLQVIPTQASTDFMMDCPFVERSLNLFRNVEEAYHQFMLDLVAQQVAAWSKVSQIQPGSKIFVGGKLASSPHFMHGLAEAFFAQEVYGVTGVSLPEWALLSPVGALPTIQRYY